jgi:hypothetical protein
MILENKYFLAVQLVGSIGNVNNYILSSKISCGPSSKAYLFDILIALISQNCEIKCLVRADDFFTIKYMQAFGANRDNYFNFSDQFDKFNLDTYHFKNFIVCDAPATSNFYGLCFTLDQNIEFDTTLDTLDLSQDFFFNERFFAGYTGFASDIFKPVSRNDADQKLRTRIGKLTKLRRSANSFENRKPPTGFLAELFKELQLLNTPVALAGGINPFHFFELDVENRKMEVNRQAVATPLSEKILDIAFLAQISKYKAKFILLICASLDPLFLKYGVRSNRFITMEAGAISHSISLYCAENNTACRIVGGFDDELLSKHLGLTTQGLYPVVALFLGDVFE